MIHLTVAAPMGIDSVFFSFIQRLALQNGHACVDPPAQNLDDPGAGGWIEKMRSSSQHHFLIGYRYPPSYWKRIAESSSTVCLVADPDGISRQVEQIHFCESEGSAFGDLRNSLHPIRHAMETTIDLAEWILSEVANRTRIMPPAIALLRHPRPALSRLERFYREAGVLINTSCSNEFSDEAIPILQQLKQPEEVTRFQIHRLLTLEEVSPSRCNAVSYLFHFDS